MKSNPEVRFMGYVSIDSSGCWLWQGYCDRDGYGKFFTEKVAGKAIKEYAHRWSYKHWVGEIPTGWQVDHLCKVRGCVNYMHLEAVTPYENNLRSDSLPAIRSRMTHCKNNHPLSGDNVRFFYRNGKPSRRCKTCERDWTRVYKGVTSPRSLKAFL